MGVFIIPDGQFIVQGAGAGAGTHTENDAENTPDTQMPAYYVVGLTQASISKDLRDKNVTATF